MAHLRLVVEHELPPACGFNTCYGGDSASRRAVSGMAWSVWREGLHLRQRRLENVIVAIAVSTSLRDYATWLEPDRSLLGA
jgi:hypothetical protein